MLSDEKRKTVLFICCIIITAAIVFHVVTSFIQRGDIASELDYIGSSLNSIKYELDGIERALY